VTPDFGTLNDALSATFSHSCKVLAVREHGDAAVALFDTHPGSQPYFYEVHYLRHEGRWLEGSSSNGCGWHRLSLESDLGVRTVWGEALADADKVRGELGGDPLDDSVSNGVYFLVWWDVPESDAESDARVIAFRVRGDWVRAPTPKEQFEALRQSWLRA
jgi:hypothetical protein